MIEDILKLMRNRENIRNIGIVAHIDHGKCVAPETRISLTNGENLEAERLFNQFKGKGEIVKENTEEMVIKLKKPILVNSFDKRTGKVKEGKITHLWKLKKTEPLIEISLENGRKIKTTKEHKFLILNKEGRIIEKEGRELKEGEPIVSSRKLIHKGMGKEEMKKEFLLELSKDKGFYIKVKPNLKKILHKKILEIGSFKIYSKINSKLKPESFYHCVWRGEYRLVDFVSVCSLFNINLAEVFNQIDWINYRGIRGRGVHSSLPIKLLENFEELYYLGGLFFGDGDLNGNITNNSKEIQENVKTIAKDFHTKCIIREFKNRAIRIEVGGITLKKILETLFLYPGNKKSYCLRVSKFLEKSDKKCISAFIRGYFDTDGGVEKNRSAISVTSRSKNFLLELQLLLYKFDIDSILNHKKGTLYISGRESLENFREIGFLISYKREDYENLLNKSKVSKNEYVPISGEVLRKLREKYNLSQSAFFNGYCNYENNRVGLSKLSLQKILDLYPKEDEMVEELNKLTKYDTSFIKIKEIKKSDKEQFVYDFSVDKFHNFVAEGFIVHNTTMTDNLLSGAGMLSEELAGKQLFTDFDKQEQERGITIYSANVSIVYNYDKLDYLINLIDTPGHVDFGADVTRAMRAVDGAVVVICAVEGVMPQTETVLRQALKERVKPILFINKVDRLIKELKLSPEEMQKRFEKYIKEVNQLIKKYAEPEFAEKWFVNVKDGSVTFGSAYKNWAISIPFMQKTKITFKDIIEYTNADKEKELAKKAPLYQVVLESVIKHLPTPLEAQKYRISKIWSGDKKSEIGKGMIECDPKSDLSGIVTKVVPDPHAGLVATARLFSGTLKGGEEVYLVGQHKKQRVQQVSIYKGPRRVQIEEALAGNIVGIVGLSESFSGETICNPENIIIPFEGIKHIFEPVVTKSIEPENIKDLPKLIEFLKQVSREDPSLLVKINEETGEYLVSGLGELHIGAKVENALKEKGIEIKSSTPIVVYRETVESVTPHEIEGKSPNKHNKFYLIVEPLEESVYECLNSGKISEEKLSKIKADTIESFVNCGLPREEAKKILDVYNKNILVNATKGIQYLNETFELLKQAFKDVCDEGPLAKEPCSKIKVKIVDAELHEDAIHRGPAQVIPAVRQAIREAILESKPRVLEPLQIIRIDVPEELVGNAMNEIQNRRGQVLNVDTELGAAIIKAKLPVAEMFGFEGALKSATGGKGFYSLINVIFEKLPASIQEQVISRIKKRKGLE